MIPSAKIGGEKSIEKVEGDELLILQVKDR